jgi:hypothetical protein
LSLVGGARLATIIHPDVPEDRGGDTSRGIKAQPEKKRPGYKKLRRLENQNLVALYWRLGLSFRQIERKTGINYQTARRWCIKYGRTCDIFKPKHRSKNL